MDLLYPVVLIIILIYLLYNRNKNNTSDEQINLTETQILWRAKQQQINEETFDPSFNTPEERLVQLYVEELNYIKNRMRPFIFSEWLIWSIASDMTFKYFIGIGWLVISCVIAPIILFGSTLVISSIIFTLAFDILMYWQHRLFEVTIRNPEWWEKFGNIDDINK